VKNRQLPRNDSGFVSECEQEHNSQGLGGCSLTLCHW